MLVTKNSLKPYRNQVWASWQSLFYGLVILEVFFSLFHAFLYKANQLKKFQGKQNQEGSSRVFIEECETKKCRGGEREGRWGKGRIILLVIKD